MIKKIKFWLECSRWYALPMSIFSWIIVFSYSVMKDGNPKNGFIALIGICAAHLATNLFDDFCDYNILKKDTSNPDKISLVNTQRGKCRYLLENEVSLSDVIKIILLYILISVFIGAYFYFTGYKSVIYYMIVGGFVVMLYPLLSYIRLSEVAVGIAFGALLFGGVYYVMTGKVTTDVFILSIPSTIFTVNLLYTDNFLDKELDKNEGKNTLVGVFKTDLTAVKFQKFIIILGYMSVFLIPIFDIADWEVFIIFVTIPLAVDLIRSLRGYSSDCTKIPDKKWYHYPFENWENIKEEQSQSFMFRMYQARNLMIYISLILSVTLWIN